jgi:hypothetical protein
LQAITLGVKATKFVQKQIEFETERITLWTDSLCSIDRLREPKKYDRFVTNRLIKIRGNFPIKHIKGEENPADLASRGVSPRELTNNLFWRHGPQWLCQQKDQWPTPAKEYNPGDEEKEIPDSEETLFELNAAIADEPTKFIINIEKFSNWIELKHSLVYTNRFVNTVCRNRVTDNAYIKAVQRIKTARES